MKPLKLDNQMNSIKLEQQREYRRKTGNISIKKYEKTARGYLMRTYRNMQSRVAGIQKKKAHLYQGLPLLDRSTFYDWSLRNDAFLLLHTCYVQSGFIMKLAPSIDRIDSSRGYVLENMRWITHSENSRNGSLRRHHAE